jgi:ketosteroid isomerase-like protein
VSVPTDVAADVVSAFLASFESGDADRIAAFVTYDFVNEHLSELGSSCAGADQYRSRLAGFLASFADRRYAVGEQLVGESTPTGTDVVVAYRFTATFEGSAVDLPGMMWFRIVPTVHGARIGRRTDLWDSLTFLRQTGQHA